MCESLDYSTLTVGLEESIKHNPDRVDSIRVKNFLRFDLESFVAVKSRRQRHHHLLRAERVISLRHIDIITSQYFQQSSAVLSVHLF